MSTMQLFVDIYRSSYKEGMYLYVEKESPLENLPELIQKQFAKKELAMSIELRPDKKLARADVNKVLAAIRDQGFYLQMPPGAEQYMQNIPNDKMSVKPQ